MWKQQMEDKYTCVVEERSGKNLIGYRAHAQNSTQMDRKRNRNRIKPWISKIKVTNKNSEQKKGSR